MSSCAPADMWEGKGTVKVKVKGQGRPLYQPGYGQVLPAFLFTPGSHKVPNITDSQCSACEENLKKSQGQGL